MVATLVESADRDEPVRVVALDADTARRIGAAVGDVVEIVNPRGAPVRAWLRQTRPAGAPGAAVSAETLAMLGARAGEAVGIRLVYAAGRRA